MSNAAWPFPIPEAPPEKLNLLGILASWVKEFIETVYWAGVWHGAFMASVLWIIVLLFFALLWFGRKRELTFFGVAGIIVGIFLWYGGRIGDAHVTVPEDPVIPHKQPPRPWIRPFRGDEPDTSRQNAAVLEAIP